MSWLYVARHGETEWNVARRLQGQLDSPLTARGRAQAGRLAAAAAGWRVDAVVSSPTGRALRTAQACAERLGLAVTVLAELAEMHHGEYAGLSWAQVEQRAPGSVAARAADRLHWRFPGGESYVDVAERAAAALCRIGGERPLVVTHAMTGRMLVRAALDALPAAPAEGRTPAPGPTVGPVSIETALGWEVPNDVVAIVDRTARTYRFERLAPRGRRAGSS